MAFKVCGFVCFPPGLKNKYTERHTCIRRQASLKRRLRFSARCQAGCAYWHRTSPGEVEHSGCLRVKVEGGDSGTQGQCPESLAPKQLQIITTAEWSCSGPHCVLVNTDE